MLETAEIGQTLDKEAYTPKVQELRTQLVEMQLAMRNVDFPVIVVVDGDDRPGIDEVINVLNNWLDPRFVHTVAFGRSSDEERERPPFWRYWRALPPRGRIGVLYGEWAHSLINDLVRRKIRASKAAMRAEQIRHFEKALTDDGAVILKFWLHLGGPDGKRRLSKATRRALKQWSPRDLDRKLSKNYARTIALVEEVLETTSTSESPWHPIESRCARYRNVAVAQTLLNAVHERLGRQAPAAPPPPETPAAPDVPAAPTILDTIDLSPRMEPERYADAFARSQKRIHKLACKANRKGVSAVLAFEGWDAAGKGGVIRRLAQGMSAQMYSIIPIAAPTEDEQAYHYLWRFWRHLPRAGRVAIFDRSWYGRVLVERVEKFAAEHEWRRAYDEINDFERQLTDHGIIVCKFWLHIDRDEQLRRFEEREGTPFKRYKITPEDWRNRDRWHEYEAAVNEMIERTSTAHSPWHIIASNDKRSARVEVLDRVASALRGVL